MVENKRAVPTTAGMVGRYALIYVAIILLGALTFAALEHWFGSTSGGGAFGFLAPILAAMTTAHLYVTRTGAAPDKGTVWRWTSFFWLASTVLDGGWAALIYAGGGLDGTMADLRTLPSGMVLAAVAVVGVYLIRFPLIRLGIGMGLRQGMRAARRS